MACPVCRACEPVPFMTAGERNYWRCETCEARFLEPCQRPTPAEERAHYLLHENDVDDPGYRRFLSKLADPLLARLTSGQSGLDYGCGPGPALAAMLSEAGHQMALFDPFFCSERSVLNATYDFITCTEAAEHFHDPAREFELFDGMLRPGGWLGLMTCFQTDDERFANWHYRMDPTHVIFYRESTLRKVAACLGWTCEIPAKDVVLMQKPNAL